MNEKNKDGGIRCSIQRDRQASIGLRYPADLPRERKEKERGKTTEEGEDKEKGKEDPERKTGRGRANNIDIKCEAKNNDL